MLFFSQELNMMEIDGFCLSLHLGCYRDLSLELLLFTLYVNDFPDYIDNAVDMYADESTLQAHAKDIKLENKLTEMLAKAAEWMKKNKLTLHLGKTKPHLSGSYLCVNKNTNITVKFNGQIIEQVHSRQIIRYTYSQ